MKRSIDIGIQHKFYKTAKWRKVAWKIYKRDEGKCRCCGKPTICGHNVDHIIPIEDDSPDELKYGEDNLQLLCIPCHNRKGSEDKLKFEKYRQNKTRNLLEGVDLSEIGN